MNAGHVMRAMLEHYRPTGVRRGVLMSVGCVDLERAAAADVMAERDMEPDRWLATLHPRSGRAEVSSQEWGEFFERYGHEYLLAILDDSVPEAIDSVAHAAGCHVVRTGATA